MLFPILIVILHMKIIPIAIVKKVAMSQYFNILQYHCNTILLHPTIVIYVRRDKPLGQNIL